MNKVKTPSASVRESFLQRAHLFLEANLDDPKVEAEALQFLKTVRKSGVRFEYPSEECPDCAACLHLSLMIAAQALEPSALH